MQSLQNIQHIQGLKKIRKLDPFQGLFTLITSMPDLIAYWPLNESSGDALNRAPATIGTLNGTLTGPTQGAAGKVGPAYSFDGVNDQVSFGDIPAISDATVLSAIAIVKTNNLTADHHIFGNGTGAAAGFVLFADDIASVSGRTDTFNIVVGDAGGQFARVEGATGANTGNFMMVGFSFTAATANGLRFYVNGAEDANSPVTTATVDDIGLSNNAVKSGQDTGNTKDMDGFIQHIAVFSRALSAAEHLRLAQVAGLA